MAGRIKHMERSRRSYRNKDQAFRNFSMRTSQSKYNHNMKKGFAEQIAAFMSLLKIGRRHQDK